MDKADEHEFWTVVRLHERPPYYAPEEGVGNRLNRAARVVYEDRLTPNSDGSYTVEGSQGHTYRVREHCSCPDSTYRKERGPCYHEIAVRLYLAWQRRLQPLLALPPTTPEERLAATPTPQEAPMPVDESAYIPEPDDAPVAVIEAPEPPPAAPVKIPREFTVNIKGKMHVLYTGLVIAARHDGLVSLSADWTYNDAELSLAHAVCTFADGRRYEESGDASPSNVSKGISPHFRRVALTRAKARCLRDALGIAECSVEEMEDTASTVPDMTQQPSDDDLKRRIWQRIKVLAPDVAREEVGRWVHEQTALALVPRHYPAILAKLEAGR